MIPVPRRMSRYSLRSVFSRTAGGLLAVLLCVSVRADELAEVNRFLGAGRHAEALARANAFLARSPRDAGMRLVKGVILAEQSRPAEAIAVFSKLIEDYPSLPEPYNNLAVLYAAAGQLEKARTTLDAALRTNPSYATAYDNLGALHAKLAIQAYDKALQLDSGDANAKFRLTLVRTLPEATDSGMLAAAPAAAAHVAPARLSGPAVTAGSSDQVAAAKPQPSSPAEKPPAAVARQEASMVEAPKPEPRSVHADRIELARAVQDWASAWSAQDVKPYLSHYADDFRLPHGQSRAAWEDDRRARIVGKGNIKVLVEAPRIAVSGNSAMVRFRQVYISDHITATTRKTLVFARQGGIWKITQESTGS